MPTDLLIIPTPRKVQVHGGSLALSRPLTFTGEHDDIARRLIPDLSPAGGDAIVHAVRDPELPHAAYTLHVDPRRILIAAGDTTGFRSAFATLAQLLGGADFQPAQRGPMTLPCLDIDDWPTLPFRGIMLDISRDKVPTMDSLRAFIDQMERLKLNHLQLYTEHTFAYADHEEVWRDASPITPQEIRELDSYCRERGVELAANQNCLGHLRRWLRLPRYAPLAEIQGQTNEWTFETDDHRRITKQGPHSLCPTDPRSLALVEDLLNQLLPCFSSPLVNIGCDEAHDVGQGRSRDAVARRGRAAVYFDWLRAVDAIIKRHGRRSMFWADIALRHPDSLHLIPDGAIPLVWGYEANTPFQELARNFRSSSPHPITPSPHHPIILAPGTSSWLSITGRTRTRRANIESACRAARELNTGILCCDWGDGGHHQHWPIALHSIAHAAHAAWTGGDPSRPFNPRAAAFFLFGGMGVPPASLFSGTGVPPVSLFSGTGVPPVSSDLGPWLDDLGEADADLSELLNLRNTNALYQSLVGRIAPGDSPQRVCNPSPVSFLPPSVVWASRPYLSHWKQVLRRLVSLRQRFDSFPPRAMPDLVRAELDHTLRLAEHAANKALLLIACLDEPGGIPRAPARIRLAAELAQLAEEHRALWPRRNRPGGLNDSLAHYHRIIDDYEGKKSRVLSPES